jgi:hypothetical protein
LARFPGGEPVPTSPESAPFAAACALASVYGFLQGAWPFGVVESVWTAVALRRWRIRAAQRAGRY